MEKSCRTCKHQYPTNDPYCDDCDGCLPEREEDRYNKWVPKEEIPQFIKAYKLNPPELSIKDICSDVELDRVSASCALNAIVERIYATSIKRHNETVIKELVNVAQRSGVTDLYILDEEAIIEALSKQIPKPLNDGCPICHCDIRAEEYCPNCGQKILIDPETGYPVREE